MDVRYLRETVRWLSELAAMTAPMGAVLDYLERFKIARRDAAVNLTGNLAIVTRMQLR